MSKELVYFKRNVPYTVVVRRNALDTIGYSLNNNQPWIAVEAEYVRDFKIANKSLIMEGAVVATEVPDVDWVTPNALSDEDITNLLKNYLALKKALETIDSISTLSRILEAAKDQDKPEKTKKLIRSRLEELTGEDEILSPAEMGGVSN